jgi:hypothetical protein
VLLPREEVFASFAFPTAVSLQQHDIELAFELADLLGRGRWCEVQDLCGGGDRAVVGHRPEDAKAA